MDSGKTAVVIIALLLLIMGLSMCSASLLFTTLASVAATQAAGQNTTYSPGAPTSPGVTTFPGVAVTPSSTSTVGPGVTLQGKDASGQAKTVTVASTALPTVLVIDGTTVWQTYSVGNGMTLSMFGPQATVNLPGPVAGSFSTTDLNWNTGFTKVVVAATPASQLMPVVSGGAATFATAAASGR